MFDIGELAEVRDDFNMDWQYCRILDKAYLTNALIDEPSPNARYYTGWGYVVWVCQRNQTFRILESGLRKCNQQPDRITNGTTIVELINKCNEKEKW